MSRTGPDVSGLGLHPGAASGELLVLEQGLSLFGGIDDLGVIVAAGHPQQGHCITGRVLAIPVARGSSSSASVLAELIRERREPAAIVTIDFDSVLVVGALAGAELYGVEMPMLQVGDKSFSALGSGRVDVHVPVAGRPGELRHRAERCER